MGRQGRKMTSNKNDNEPRQKHVDLGLQESMPEVFKKSHELIFSRQRLSVHEQNIFNLMVAHMREEHWNSTSGPSYEFPAQILSDWFDIDSNHLSSTLGPVADRLATRTVGFTNTETNEWDYIPILARIKYKNAKLIIIPNPELKEQYIDYSKKGFALINRRPLYKLKKSYSKRLYEILSRFKQEGHLRTLTIDELKGYFGLFDENGNLSKGNQSLGPVGVFIKRCIAESFQEISEISKHELVLFKSDKGELGYSLIKKGRVTTGIKFHYKWIDHKVSMSEDTAKDTIRELETKISLKKEKLTIPELNLLAEAYMVFEDTQTANEIYEVINEREASLVMNPEQKAQDEKKKFLEKIKQMKAASNVGY
jgi:plasmid replication initiation protein